MIPITDVWISILAFIASIINGAIGYGFSSIITPIAVLFISNKILNPALVVCELGVNIVLLFSERRNINSTWKRAVPFIVGLIPGVIVGSLALDVIAATSVKIALYVLLLPLIIIQLIGISWPIKNERRAAPFVGGAVGFLYSLTTISGPPLALFWRNQGLSKDEFRCIISQIRVAEATFTTISYLILGLFAPDSTSLVPFVFLPVILGIPIGIYLFRTVSPELFKRLVMCADGLLVLFGLTNTLSSQNYITAIVGYGVFFVGAILVILLTIKVVKGLSSKERELYASTKKVTSHSGSQRKWNTDK